MIENHMVCGPQFEDDPAPGIDFDDVNDETKEQDIDDLRRRVRNIRTHILKRNSFPKQELCDLLREVETKL